MVQITLQISDEYIQKHLDIRSQLEKSENNSGEDFAHKLVEFLSFSHLKRKAEEGVNEYTISSDEINDKTTQRIFDNTAIHAGSLCIAVEADRKKGGENHGTQS